MVVQRCRCARWRSTWRLHDRITRSVNICTFDEPCNTHKSFDTLTALSTEMRLPSKDRASAHRNSAHHQPGGRLVGLQNFAYGKHQTRRNLAARPKREAAFREPAQRMERAARANARETRLPSQSINTPSARVFSQTANVPASRARNQEDACELEST